MDSSSSQDKIPVPKFGSFKPQRASSEAAPPDRRSRDTHRRDVHESSRSARHRHEHLSRSKSPRRPDRGLHRRSSERQSHSRHRLATPSTDHHRSRERKLSREERVLRSRPDLIPSQTPGESQYETPLRGSSARDIASGDTTVSASGASDLFELDSKGDPYNLVFGSSHRYQDHDYRRVGGGYVLGAPNLRIDREASRGDTVVLYSSEWSGIQRKGPGLKPLSEIPRLAPPKYHLRNYSIFDLTDDFVKLHHDLDNDWGKLPPVRFTHHEQELEDELSPYLKPISDSPIAQIDLEAERKAENAKLWQAVDFNPNDVGAWLRLIDHQELMILGPEDSPSNLTFAQRHSLADVKLSLYEKALRAATDTPHKDRLLLGRLQEGSQLWNAERLSVEWEKTLQENPEWINIWVKYLDFRQTGLKEFDFHKCLAIFRESLEFNARSMTGPGRTHIQCYLFLRLTLFLRESGYTELAVGLWQAVLEFTCFIPFDVADDESSALSAFAQFWDSEVPRIGESGAHGWRHGSEAGMDPTMLTYHANIDHSSLLASWAKAERERIGKALKPFRSLDGFSPDVNDPFTMVLSSDIIPIVQPFWGLDNADELIDGLMYFCHLPHLTHSMNFRTTRVWGWDNFLRNEYINNPRYGLSLWVPADRLDSQPPPSPFSFPASNFLHTTDTLFANSMYWFSSFQLWTSDNQAGPPGVDRDWARRTMWTLMERHPEDDELAEHAFAFEFACNPDRAKKLAKDLVKRRPSNLRLWNAFALMNSNTGDDVMANSVWAIALSKTSNSVDKEMAERGILWNSWIWNMLRHEKRLQASYTLHAMPEGKITELPETDYPIFFSPPTILKTQQFLRECQDRTLAARRAQAYTAYTDCLALLHYLGDWPLKAVFDVYADAISRMKDMPSTEEILKEFIAEQLHQSRAKLLYFHINCSKTSKAFRPMEIRNWLKESIALFPHNTIFLSLSMWNESRVPIYDRLRDVHDLTRDLDPDRRYQLDNHVCMPTVAPQRVPISTHLFTIYLEICRPIFTGSTSYSTRAAFERALGERRDPAALTSGKTDAPYSFDADNARSNLSIWKLYILYELYGTQNADAARAVFYRALQACPWSKELAMLAFEHLRDDLPSVPRLWVQQTGLKFSELCEVYHVLCERHMRIHLNIAHEVPRDREVISPDDVMNDSP